MRVPASFAISPKLLKIDSKEHPSVAVNQIVDLRLKIKTCQ